jgi:hypothetical protein
LEIHFCGAEWTALVYFGQWKHLGHALPGKLQRVALSGTGGLAVWDRKWCYPSEIRVADNTLLKVGCGGTSGKYCQQYIVMIITLIAAVAI